MVNRYHAFCDNVYDQYSENMWQEVWALLKSDLQHLHASFCAYLQ